MSSIQFQPFCCKCFRRLEQRDGALVFSCGDYLCHICCSDSTFQSCPGCGKQNIKSLPLGNNLPEEVERNMSDIANTLQSLHQTLAFQIKYYKQTLALMHPKMEDLSPR